MADFALGLTKTAVQGTLNKVKSAIEEEGKLRVRVQDDLVFISGEFQMMQSFLKASNAGGRASQDEVVQAWVRQLRELAFDVEDCVEFVIHLDKASRWDWVRRFVSSVNWVAPPLPLDVAVADIKRLKVRVEDLSQRNTRYNLFSTSSGGGGDGDGSSSDQQQLMHLAGCTTSSTEATGERFHVLRDVWQAMGKLIRSNGELKRLIDCEGSELKVISLWRTQQVDVVGEPGWVTIAKKAYDDPEICQEFKNRAWVKLSTHHPFNPVEFLNKLLSQFTKSHPHHHHHDDISELMLQVRQHRYLVVLETELSSVADWDAIRMYLPDGKNGSRIIVSTKHLGIALVCTGDPYQVSELRFYSHNRYLCAIFPKGCGHRIGMGELYWQLRRPRGVISLFWRTDEVRSQLADKLSYYDTRMYRIFDGVKFELNLIFHVTELFKVVDLALFILSRSYSEGGENACEQLKGMMNNEQDSSNKNNEQDIIKMARNFMTEHNCLLFIIDLESTTVWNLIKQDLLCESTRGCIIVITSKQSVATHCVGHKQHRVLNAEEVMKDRGHHIGMSELFWQLKRHDGVVSLFWQNDEERSQLMDKLYSCQYMVFDGVKFELVDLALFILVQSYPEDEQEKECKKLRGMHKKQGIIEMGRKFLTEHNCLLFITNLESATNWNLIKQHLLYESTRGYIVVITSDRSVAEHCVGHEQERVLNVKDLMEGCGHRIGMSELFWQLRGQCGVISLFWQTDDERSQLMDELDSYDIRKYRVFDGVKFELHCCFYGTEDGRFKLVDLALFILAQSYPEDEQQKECEELRKTNYEKDIIKMGRTFLTEHNCLLFITSLESTEDWKSIKKHLLCESTRGYIVVITSDQSLAEHCVGHEQERVLNVKDLMEGSHQEDQRGHADGGSNIEEEGKFELETLVARKFEIGFFDETRFAAKTWSVWGVAGVGKSALVRQYYSEIKCTQVYRMFVWVDVPDPFSLMDLCQRLLLDLYSDDVDVKEAVAIGMLEGQDPIQGCIKILLEHKCLLVFDGIRSTHDWDLINTTLLFQPISGRTIVITREERIARHCHTNATSHILNVRSLESEDCFDLFTKILFNGKPLFPEAVDISKRILSKCGGLPEVIVAIGKQIRKPQQQAYSLLQILNFINDHFMRYLSELPSLRGLLSWMQSYFDSCSDELKPCIFYMSVFPADQSIRWSRLLMRWIAEGYLPGGPAEGKGLNLMLELGKLSILYPEKKISKYNFKLNGFFREYIKSRPMEDNRVFELDGSCSPSLRLTGQHLTISSSWDRDKIVFESLDLSRLRSFTVFGDWKSFLICDKMKLLRVLDLEGTSTSDSTASVTDDDLEQIGKLLPRLKFMSLRGCRLITYLPDSLGDMKQLETLDAKYTSIVELPHVIITKLHKLQCIRVGTTEGRLLLVPTGIPAPPTPAQEDGHDGMSPFLQAKITLSRVVQGASTGAWKMTRDLEESCRRLCQIKNQRRRRRVAANGGGVEVIPSAAKGIGELTDLHTLGIVNVAGGKGGFLFLKELKKLTQLRKLRLSGITRKNWHGLCVAISGHRHLECLSLKLLLLEEGSNYDFACFDAISEPPKNLIRLKVLYTTNAGPGVGGAWIRPTWIKHVGSIKWIDHELTISSQEDIDLLYTEALPGSRDRLCIKPIEQHLSFHYGLVFNVVRIYCSSISSTVTFGGPMIFQIKELNIHCCNSCGWSCLRIFGLQDMENLKKVLVTGSCSNDFKKDLRRELEEHPNEPELIITCDQ